ncbi:hypothetical protein ACHAW6_016195 [Cyclotella cf. meneghiniana]
MDCPYAASAAKLERTQEDIAVEFLTIGGEDCKSTFQQIYLSPHPYFDAFEEQLDIRRTPVNRGGSTGLCTHHGVFDTSIAHTQVEVKDKRRMANASGYNAYPHDKGRQGCIKNGIHATATVLPTAVGTP